MWLDRQLIPRRGRSLFASRILQRTIYAWNVTKCAPLKRYTTLRQERNQQGYLIPTATAISTEQGHGKCASYRIFRIRHDRSHISIAYRSTRPLVKFADGEISGIVESDYPNKWRLLVSRVMRYTIGLFIRAIHSLEGFIAGGIDDTFLESQRANARFPAERRDFTRRIRNLSYKRNIIEGKRDNKNVLSKRR